MKSLLFIFVIITLLAGFSDTDYQVSRKTGEVKQIEGLYIFFASEPVMETEYIGTVDVKITSNGKSITRLNAMISKTKKEYPDADAIIFKTIDFGSADVVKYK